MQVTTKEISSAINIIKAVADGIRELKQVPSGHLYATLAPLMSLERFTQIIGILKQSGLVKEDNMHRLIWVEPSNQ